MDIFVIMWVVYVTGLSVMSLATTTKDGSAALRCVATVFLYVGLIPLMWGEVVHDAPDVALTLRFVFPAVVSAGCFLILMLARWWAAPEEEPV